jgi:molecular chaperone DnaK
LGTGKEQSIRITASSGLSEEEIEKLIKEAESHSEEDKKKKELAEARNEADGLLYTTERSLSEFGDKIDQQEKSNVEAAIKNLKSAIEGTDVEAIKSATAELTKVSHKLAEAMYSQASAGTTEGEGSETAEPEGPGAESSASGDDVVDADFEEVTDEDKD